MICILLSKLKKKKVFYFPASVADAIFITSKDKWCLPLFINWMRSHLVKRIHGKSFSRFYQHGYMLQKVQAIIII